MFQHHSEVINYLIQLKGYESYLEIGVHRPAGNFDKIKCKFKIGVDPNGEASFTGTSDEWFTTQGTRFDIIFIDGLHHADQVKKDFDNAMLYLNESGVILIHDTNPEKEEYACVPRNGLRGRWNGDVWKFVADDLWQNEVDWRTLNFDSNGLTVVKRKRCINVGIEGARDWAYFVQNRDFILRLCNDQQLKEWITL